MGQDIATARQAQQLQGGPQSHQAGQPQQQIQASAQPVPRPQPQQQSQQAGPAPLNAINLEKNSQALKQSIKGFKVPSAPTTSQPAFNLGAPSPHGNPSYATPQAANMELKIPQRKRAKISQPGQNSQPATPSPQVSKTSPARPQPQEVQHRSAETLKPVLVCKEPECELSHVGYANEQDLRRHTDEEHTRPRADPLKFAQDSLAIALGLDSDGSVKEGQKAATVLSMSLSAPRSGQGLTPGNLTASTPISQDGAAMKRPTGKGDDKQTNTPPAVDPWACSALNSQALLTVLGLPDDIHPVISDPSAFRSLTPKDTPESSKDSGASEPNSDISEGASLDIDVNWQSFDNLDGDLVLNMNRYSLQGGLPTADEVPTMDPALLFTTSSREVDWDEVRTDFSKPFRFDASLYSMDYDT